MIRFTLMVIFTSINIYSQTFLLEGELGKFSSASSLSINAAGYIYVSDMAKNEVYKLNSAGEIIKTVGGYGWGKESFDYPIDVYSTTLNVYVTDHNNNRIQFFDKDLNFLLEFGAQNFSNSSYSFAYPKGCVVSNQGDIFVLDGDNQRILKFNSDGNFLTEIGNTDAGEYMLDNPNKIAITNDGKLFVTDENIVKVFDVFGTGILKITTGFQKASVNVSGFLLTLNDSSEVKFINLSKDENKFIEFTPIENDETIIDALATENFLYVLTPTRILKYSYKF